MNPEKEIGVANRPNEGNENAPISLILTADQIPDEIKSKLPADLRSIFVAHVTHQAPKCLKYFHNRYLPYEGVLGRCRVQFEIGPSWSWGTSSGWSRSPSQIRFYEVPDWFTDHANDDDEIFTTMPHKVRESLVREASELLGKTAVNRHARRRQRTREMAQEAKADVAEIFSPPD